MRVLAALFIGLALGGSVARAEEVAPKLAESTVGLPVRAEQLVLPGTELEPVPWDDASPVVVRIEAVYPHGTALRYDLNYQGLEPGEYDLRKYLRRKDGSTVDDLPPLEITIRGLLPSEHITPHDPGFSVVPWLGGYRVLLAVGTVVWLLVLIWVIFPPRRADQVIDAQETRVTLAERLRPLIGRAMRGELSSVELAQFERALVSYWRRRRSLEDCSPAEATRRLRSDAQAGPLLTQVEAWLHSPTGAQNVDVAALLAPFQDLPAEDLDLAPVAVDAGAIPKRPVVAGASHR
ncbi:MAG TPA: hypothetical protein VGN12_20590 [Pirellulales bacterium]|jgi:hypothetical protein